MLQCKDCIKHRPDYTISRELIVQQLVWVQSTDHYTENKTFNFANLFGASWDLNQARIGRRNGMIFCMGSTYGSMVVCRWSNFLMVKELHDFVLEFRFGHCELIRRTLGAERALAWNSLPPYPCLGRPQEVWDITLEMFCRFTAFDSC